METTIIEKYEPHRNRSPANWRLELGPHERIIGVNFRCACMVNVIEFIVADKNERTTTRSFGGEGGGARDYLHKIRFKQNEYMTQISGRHAFQGTPEKIVVASIKIHTNLNPNGYGPYGEASHENTQDFSLPLPSSASDLVGFFGGHRGTNLEFVGAYIKRTIRKLGPWGSPYPPNWNLELGPQETIKEVRVRSGWVVDGLEFVTGGGGMKTTFRSFGGRGGSSHKIQLEPNEHITGISGTCGLFDVSQHWHLASIKIHTDLRPYGYGPYGEKKNCKNIHDFSCLIPSGCVIAGFFGRAGEYFDCIGVYTKTIY